MDNNYNAMRISFYAYFKNYPYSYLTPSLEEVIVNILYDEFLTEKEGEIEDEILENYYTQLLEEEINGCEVNFKKEGEYLAEDFLDAILDPFTNEEITLATLIDSLYKSVYNTVKTYINEIIEDRIRYFLKKKGWY